MPDAASGLTSLGVATADQTGYAGGTFGGVSVGAGNVLVMYTYAGDANLDGFISGDGLLGDRLQHPGPQFARLVQRRFQLRRDRFRRRLLGDRFQLPRPGGAVSVTAAPAPSSLSGVTAVPEPTSALCVAAVGSALLARRRRRRHA
jgi:hypothetical protein